MVEQICEVALWNHKLNIKPGLQVAILGESSNICIGPALIIVVSVWLFSAGIGQAQQMQTAAGLQAAKQMSENLNNLGELMLTAASSSAESNTYISEGCARAISFIADEVPITNMEKLMCK